LRRQGSGDFIGLRENRPDQQQKGQNRQGHARRPQNFTQYVPLQNSPHPPPAVHSHREPARHSRVRLSSCQEFSLSPPVPGLYRALSYRNGFQNQNEKAFLFPCLRFRDRKKRNGSVVSVFLIRVSPGAGPIWPRNPSP
jgi:hypothetical protein